MDIKFLAAFLFSLIAAFGAQSQTVVKHGIAKTTPDGSVILVVSQPLSKNDSVYLQYSDEKSQKTLCCKRVPSALFKKLDNGESLFASNELDDKAIVLLQASLNDEWAKTAAISAAMIGSNLQVKLTSSDGLVSRKNGNLYKSTTCLSQEGFHMRGTKNRGLTTHLYLPLGYDLERPTCK